MVNGTEMATETTNGPLGTRDGHPVLRFNRNRTTGENRSNRPEPPGTARKIPGSTGKNRSFSTGTVKKRKTGKNRKKPKNRKTYFFTKFLLFSSKLCFLPMQKVKKSWKNGKPGKPEKTGEPENRKISFFKILFFSPKLRFLPIFTQAKIL